MTSTTRCVDWSDFIPLKYNKYIADNIGGKIEYIWSWLGETSDLPHMYTIRKINVKYCKFNSRIRYRKMFCGHKFKIGGNKE
jgi:hypothetical protein